MPGPARFTIRAASALTGINQNTLRAWERRHGLVRPERTPKGYRLYTHEDLAMLRRIQAALLQGIPLSRVREVVEAVADASAEAAAPGTGAPVAVMERDPARSLESFAHQIENATIRFDRAGLDRSFNRAVGLHSLRTAYRHALCPALRRIGERYLGGVASVSEEHFLEAYARERLGASLAGLRPLHQQPRVLCACPAGELHELGLMLLGLEVALEGVSTLYLGRDVPVEAILHAAATSTCRVVALSCTMRLPEETVRELRDRLEAHARRPALLVGGPAAVARRDWLEARRVGVLPLEHDAAGAMVMAALRRR